MYYNITIYVGVLLLNCPVARELFGAQKKASLEPVQSADILMWQTQCHKAQSPKPSAFLWA